MLEQSSCRGTWQLLSLRGWLEASRESRMGLARCSVRGSCNKPCEQRCGPQGSRVQGSGSRVQGHDFKVIHSWPGFFKICVSLDRSLECMNSRAMLSPGCPMHIRHAVHLNGGNSGLGEIWGPASPPQSIRQDPHRHPRSPLFPGQMWADGTFSKHSPQEICTRKLLLPSGHRAR